MTIAELITELNKYPPAAPVLCEDAEWGPTGIRYVDFKEPDPSPGASQEEAVAHVVLS